MHSLRGRGREEHSWIHSKSPTLGRWKVLACWDGNVSPSSSPWGESAASMNPHTRLTSPFVHSRVQQHLKPCHQGDAVWVHQQMCDSFSRTEAKASSSGPGHGAHASTTSQKTFDWKTCLWLQDWEERWVRKSAVAPYSLRPEKFKTECGLMLIHVWL